MSLRIIWVWVNAAPVTTKIAGKWSWIPKTMKTKEVLMKNTCMDDHPRHGSNTDPILVVSDHGSLYFLNRHNLFAGD
jgi:hypothetical protein